MSFITRLILLIKEFIEKISQLIEIVIWYFRNTIVRTVGLLLTIPIAIYLYSYGKQAIKTGQTELIILGVIILATELTLRYLNSTNKKKTKRPIVTMVDRIISLLPYIWSVIEISRGLSISLTEYLRHYPKIFDPFYSILHLYENLPGQQFGLTTFAVFGLCFFGIGRNPSLFPFVVRYHAVQAILTESVFYFNIHLFQLWSERRISDDFLVTKIALIMYGYMLFSYCLLALTALLGIPTKIAFLHEAIIYHIDEEGANRNDL